MSKKCPVCGRASWPDSLFEVIWGVAWMIIGFGCLAALIVLSYATGAMQ